jgi:hypothetical protein
MTIPTFAARQLAPSGVAVRPAPTLARKPATREAADVPKWPIPEAFA